MKPILRSSLVLLIATGCATQHPRALDSFGAIDIQPLIDEARNLQQKSEFAERYPILIGACRSNLRPGYEVTFGRVTGSGNSAITYYFDREGHYVDWLKWFRE